MSQLGTLSLVLALALAGYSLGASVAGGRQRNGPLLVSAQRAAYATVPALAVGVFALVTAFLQNEFSIRYVAEHSNLAMPRIYTWVAFYAGNEGSLLFVCFALAAMWALGLSLSPRYLGTLRPYANAVAMLILVFFTGVTLLLANPFVELAAAPVDGLGINPLLTHPGMFIHPPLIMTGLTAVTVPFAFGMGALISGRVDDDWVDVGRVWGLVAWVVLGIGLLLGAWWAYTILGWGGYWAWDPVENAALMPWLGLTAFIHSIMVQKRRGMFRMWNIALVNISFALGAFGIFINRGGPVPSVHSFGASTLGWVFLLFLGVAVVGSFGVFFWRMSILRGSASLESTLSREAAFLVNNLLLLTVAFVTMWGVVFPLISEFVTGETITVAEPFYNQVNGPLLLALVLLMGIGPLLPWRRATWASVRSALVVPAMLTAVAFAALLAMRVFNPIALIAFTVSAFVAASVLQEWARGTRARRRASGDAYPLAFLRLIAANRPRYGGYVVHLAVVMLAFGIIGSQFYNLERDVILGPGDRATIGAYEVEFLGWTTVPFVDRTERTATIDLFRGGTHVKTMEAWQGLYPSFQILSTRAAIHTTPREDVYVLFSEVQPDGESAVFRLLVNPLVWWMWLAGPFVLLGTVVALWPSRQRAVASVPAALPGGAVTAKAE